MQQDGRGAKKLFHHAADPSGRIHRYWLEAEETHHKAGRHGDAAREALATLVVGEKGAGWVLGWN